MSNRKFNATVTTTALNGSTVELQDTMIFSGVDQKFVDFLTGSCKLAVMHLMRLLPSFGDYTLHYKTIVTDAETGEAVVDRPGVTLDGLTKKQLFGFLNFAVKELGEANSMRYGKNDSKDE